MRKLKFYFAPAFIILAALMIFQGCKKNTELQFQHPDDRQNELSIMEAKAWYEQQGVSNNISYRSATEKKFNFKIHSINWNKARNTSDSNYDIVETPVNFDQSPGLTFSNSIGTHNSAKANDVVRLLILKDKKSKTMRSAFMHIVSDSGIPDTSSTYGKRKSDLSGFIFFTNLDGGFINGWKYENGKITRKSGKSSRLKNIYTGLKKTAKRINMNDAISLEAPPDNVVCTTYETDWFERTCTEYTNGITTCTEWTYMYSTYDTYCTEKTGDGLPSEPPNSRGNIEYDIPATPKPPPAPDPCAVAESLKNNSAFKTNFNNLKSKTNETKEYGYLFTNNSSGGTEFQSIEGESDQKEINFQVSNKIDGLIHSHYTSLLSVFSPDDIYAMAELYTLNKMVDPGKFALGVVTAQGTQYLLMINDLTKFKSFAENMVSNSTLDLFSTIYGTLYKIKPSNNNDDNEKAFLQFINATNSGLTLFKGNNDFSDWQKRGFDTNGNVINIHCLINLIP